MQLSCLSPPVSCPAGRKLKGYGWPWEYKKYQYPKGSYVSQSNGNGNGQVITNGVVSQSNGNGNAQVISDDGTVIQSNGAIPGLASP